MRRRKPRRADRVLQALDRAGYDGWLCVDEESDASLERGFAASREWLNANGR